MNHRDKVIKIARAVVGNDGRIKNDYTPEFLENLGTPIKRMLQKTDSDFALIVIGKMPNQISVVPMGNPAYQQEAEALRELILDVISEIGGGLTEGTTND